MVVSEPQTVGASLSGGSGIHQNQVAYVSAEPGTFPGGISVRIRNLSTGGVTPVIPLAEAGFDPVAVAASPGDDLELQVRQADDTITLVRLRVPPRKPPRVVRTNPPKGRADVALSIRIDVVFSEPIDPGSLTPTALRVLGGGSAVPGSLSLVPGSPFTVRFTPAGSLKPSTDYELVVAPAIRDFDGDPLEEEIRVRFRTESTSGGSLVVSNLTSGGAFDLDGYRVRVTVVGQPPRTSEFDLNESVRLSGLPQGHALVELEDVAANCAVESGSSTTVMVPALEDAQVEFRVICTPPPGLEAVGLLLEKFTEPPSYEGDVHLWSMNADGSKLRQLTDGIAWDWAPATSPDGVRIAFTRASRAGGRWTGQEIHLMNQDGSTIPLAHYAACPSWSPDGSRLVVRMGGIRLIETVGVRPGQLIAGDGSGSTLVHAAWSPDGKTIAYVKFISASELNGQHSIEIWAVGADGTNPKRLSSPGPDGVSMLAWSSDGSRISFKYGGGQLWTMNADGSNPARLLELPHPDIWFTGWSPDRKLLIGTRARSWVGWDIVGDIYLLNIETGGLVRVTSDGRNGVGRFQGSLSTSNC